jgi:hypothetical protein
LESADPRSLPDSLSRLTSHNMIPQLKWKKYCYVVIAVITVVKIIINKSIIAVSININIAIFSINICKEKIKRYDMKEPTLSQKTKWQTHARMRKYVKST